MNALLVHGMGRGPASMWLLRRRLRAHAIGTQLFRYSTFSGFDAVVGRLVRRVQALPSTEPFILVGHSLGSVLIRAALPSLSPLAPAACFFLAPPCCACQAARLFHRHAAFRALTRHMGDRLASPAFMAALPVPAVPTRIYAGTAGPRGRLSPFGNEPNDGILRVSETTLGALPVVGVPALHAFIMNSAAVARDIIQTAQSLPPSRGDA
ncbi:MAG: esterase/lipase family protein [Acidobacteriota bacterium]